MGRFASRSCSSARSFRSPVVRPIAVCSAKQGNFCYKIVFIDLLTIVRYIGLVNAYYSCKNKKSTVCIGKKMWYSCKNAHEYFGTPSRKNSK